MKKMWRNASRSLLVAVTVAGVIFSPVSAGVSAQDVETPAETLAEAPVEQAGGIWSPDSKVGDYVEMFGSDVVSMTVTYDDDGNPFTVYAYASGETTAEKPEVVSYGYIGYVETYYPTFVSQTRVVSDDGTVSIVYDFALGDTEDAD